MGLLLIALEMLLVSILYLRSTAFATEDAVRR